MRGRNERNSQVRMSSSLWNQVGEISQELGNKDPRGGHSAVIREIIVAAVAKWLHSPYVCRSARHTVYVSGTGDIFFRHVQSLRLNSLREKLPCGIEMKPEKRRYYHNLYRRMREFGRLSGERDEHGWFLDKWLLNHFAVWPGKKDADDLEAFQQRPLSSHVDTFGTTSKSADLEVHAVGGRFLTREIIIGLRDYVQWKEPNTPIFDRVGIPINIPTSDFEMCVVVDQDLFKHLHIEQEEIASLALEFRNLESARFEGKEVALYPEIEMEEQIGRTPGDDDVDEMLRKVRRLWQRVTFLMDSKTTEGDPVVSEAARSDIKESFRLPEKFLFYWLRWPSPHLGIEACVRWEKPLRGTDQSST